MFQRLNNRFGHYLLLLSISACLLLPNLGGPALWDIDEGRNATCVLEMVESGNWVVPTFNGQLRSHKPALLYWLQAAAYLTFGVNEFAARLPSALAAMLTVLLVYELGRRMFNAGTGLLGGLILASSTQFCVAAHFANPDALLLTCTTATMLLLWLGFARSVRKGDRPLLCEAPSGPFRQKGSVPFSHGSSFFVLAGATTGLAMLAKGPVGVVLPAAVWGLFLLWSRRWRVLCDRAWIWSVLVFALVALPWYILVAIDTKLEFLSDFLLTHNLERALSPMENHTGRPWYYLAVLAVGLVPWSVFLGSAVWYGSWSALRLPWCAIRQPWSRARDAESGEIDTALGYRLLWCWIAVYLLAFTIAATKLPNYILPVVPALALLIARFLDRWRRGLLQVPSWIQSANLAVLTLTGLTITVGLLIAGGAIEVARLHGRTFPGLELWSALGAVPLAGAAFGAWCLYRQRRTAFVAVMLLAAVGLLAPLAAAGSVALNDFRAPKPLVEQAGALQRDRDIRIGCYQLEFLPSLNFYVQRNVKHFESAEQAADFLRYDLTVFLFLSRRDWEQLEPHISSPHRVLATHRDMYRAGEVVVVTNR